MNFKNGVEGKFPPKGALRISLKKYLNYAHQLKHFNHKNLTT